MIKRFRYIDARSTRSQAEALIPKYRKEWRELKVRSMSQPQRAGKPKPAFVYGVFGRGWKGKDRFMR